MFSAKTYFNRRKELCSKINNGIVVLLGNGNSSINFEDNFYPHRQDSTFLYYSGLKDENLHLIIDTEENTTSLFGNDLSLDHIVWMGNQPTMREKAESAGIENSYPLDSIKSVIDKALKEGRSIHYLPPYRPEHRDTLAQWIAGGTIEPSTELIYAIASQRNIKTNEEIEEMHKAGDIAAEMHEGAMKLIKPGMKEYEISGFVEGKALQMGGRVSFLPIATINGHILHNHHYGNTAQDGQMFLLDCGAETSMGYASDRTSTFPVNGTFSETQKHVYNTVLSAYQSAANTSKAGVEYVKVHLESCKVIAEGMKELGVMKGNVEDAVTAGAHALFMPHGLGHLLGLDVHDMENFGEEYIGYTHEKPKSSQFGLKSLRLGKALEEGYVITIEPGIYFIPELIKRWKGENLHNEFINYDRLTEYYSFGGVRIEDDFLITENGTELIGRKNARTVEEIEQIQKQTL